MFATHQAKKIRRECLVSLINERVYILASCCLRPMRRNSVLDEFRVKRFAVMQEDRSVVPHPEDC